MFVELLINFIHLPIYVFDLLDCRLVEVELLITVVLPLLQFLQLLSLQQLFLQNLVNFLLALNVDVQLAECFFHLSLVFPQFVNFRLVHVELSEVCLNSSQLTQVISQNLDLFGILFESQPEHQFIKQFLVLCVHPAAVVVIVQPTIHLILYMHIYQT